MFSGTVATCIDIHMYQVVEINNRYPRNLGWWFSPGPPVSSTNKTDRHNTIEILLKVALNTIKPNIFSGR